MNGQRLTAFLLLMRSHGHYKICDIRFTIKQGGAVIVVTVPDTLDDNPSGQHVLFTDYVYKFDGTTYQYTGGSNNG